MTVQESEQYEALLIWVKALDAAAALVQAKIAATQASKRSDVREDRKAGCDEWVAARF